MNDALFLQLEQYIIIVSLTLLTFYRKKNTSATDGIHLLDMVKVKLYITLQKLKQFH